MIQPHHALEAEQYTRRMVARAIEALYPAHKRDEALKRSCLLHSFYLASKLQKLGYRAMIQGGSAFWNIERVTPEGVHPLQYGYEFVDNLNTTMMIQARMMPELHCWVATTDGIIIDLTTRYIPALAVLGGCKCDRMQSDSLWIDVKNWPAGVSYHPTAQGCAAALVMLGSLVLREFPCPVLTKIHQFHMERMK